MKTVFLKCKNAIYKVFKKRKCYAFKRLFKSEKLYGLNRLENTISCCIFYLAIQLIVTFNKKTQIKSEKKKC